jgi:r-opsin
MIISLFQMRLATSMLLAVIILPCLRTTDLPQPEDSGWTEYVKKIWAELNSMNKKLNENLENASLEIDGFLLSRNETSAYRTIEIVREYISGREEFIAQIHVLTESVPLLANLSFLDEVRWTKEINHTKNELSKLERVMKLYQTLLKLIERNEKVNNITEQFKLEGNVRHLASAVNLTGELVMEIRSFIHEVSDVRNFTLTHNLTGVITNLWIEQLLDVQNWEHLLRNKTEELHTLERTNIPIVFNKYIRSSLSAIIFVVGLAENGVLITIFARYPKIRKYRNMIILNLSIADTLSLIVNLPVRRLYQWMSSRDASPATAQIFMFYCFLCFGLSVFSVVALCLQRFSTTLKLSVRSGFILRQSTKHNSILLIAAVWVSAIVFAIPHGLYGCIYFEACFNTNVELYSKIAKTIFLIDVISLSVIPTIAITTLYWFTARHLKLRAQQLPVDMPEYQRTYQRKVLSRSRNIVMLTPIVFAVTSLPYYVYIAVVSFLGIDINSVSYTVVEGILYCLISVNCSFNPAALYVTSRTFRHYIKMNLFWWERNKSDYTKQQLTQAVLCNTLHNRVQTTVDTSL